MPERAGPGPGDGSSVLSMYHSHTDEVGDTYGGLIGPMVITRAGMAKADGSPIDVDREVFNMFEVADENQSPYLARNIREHAGDPSSVNPDDDEFDESNLMHSINGYVYGNGPTSCCTPASGCAGTCSAWAPRSTCTRRTGTATR